MQVTSSNPVVIVGGGPAGLTAGYELTKHGVKSVVLEKANRVGGISRTETYKGYRFDIGGHRFFTKVGEVEAIWDEILQDDFIQVARLSRIYYDGKFYDYPLSLINALVNLGIFRSAQILASYVDARIRSRLNSHQEAKTFEDWVINSFGNRLYQIFFKPYTEKVWGIPCDQILADWAAQRIQDMSLKRVVMNAVFGSHRLKSLTKTFNYPRLGPGMMWERCQALLQNRGTQVLLNTDVVRIDHNKGKVTKIVAKQGDQTIEFTANHFVNSMPVARLMQLLNPLPPENILAAAGKLNYRDFLIVSLIINRDQLFPDNWLYIHSPEFKVGRIQNFKNWSLDMVPDASKSCLGMEYFCNEADELWLMQDSALIELASEEIIKLGLGVKRGDIEDGCIIRERKAYPVYDGEYRQHLKVLQDYIESFDNLQTVGRNGMHRYNNQDHSMLTALLAARNIMGENHDLWNVNVERSYHEDFTKEDWSRISRPSSGPGRAGV